MGENGARLCFSGACPQKRFTLHREGAVWAPLHDHIRKSPVQIRGRGALTYLHAMPGKHLILTSRGRSWGNPLPLPESYLEAGEVRRAHKFSEPFGFRELTGTVSEGRHFPMTGGSSVIQRPVLEHHRSEKGHWQRSYRRHSVRGSRQYYTMDLITTWRHLFSAVLKLGSDQGTVEERLREAYRGSLSQIQSNPGLPAPLSEDYEKLMTQLADLYNGGGTVDVKRASRLAKQVVAIYDRVAKELQ